MEKVTKELVEKLVKQAKESAEQNGACISDAVVISAYQFSYFRVLTSKLSKDIKGRVSARILPEGTAWVSVSLDEKPLPAKIIQAAANASRVSKDNPITEEEYLAIKQEFAAELDRLSQFVKRDLLQAVTLFGNEM